MPRWPLVMLAAAGVAAPSAQGAPRAPGKVVRIERPRRVGVAPRLCEMRADGGGMCFGSEPAIGEVITVFDDTSPVAESAIKSALPFSVGKQSGCTTTWRVQTELLRGKVGPPHSGALGIVDPSIRLDDHRARLFPRTALPASPSGNVDEHVLAAIDADGDGAADIVVTQTTCPDHTSSMCFDEWVKSADRFVRVQTLNLVACGL